MRRSEEDQEIVDRGKLWIEFKNTEWYRDLSAYLDSKLESLKDSVVMLTLNQKYEEAKAEAQKMAGFWEVKDYIENEAVERMNHLTDLEKENRDYKNSIPSHVS